jgi:hypothetical protein
VDVCVAKHKYPQIRLSLASSKNIVAVFLSIYQKRNLKKDIER